MKPNKIIELKFNTPLHLGTVRDDYAKSNMQIHSDTLYSAIIQSWAILGCSEILESLAKNNGIPSFTISSFFPFTIDDKNEKVYFLPKILKRFNLDSNSDNEVSKNYKLLKKIKWLDLDFFKKLVSNEEIKLSLSEIQDKFLSKKKIKKFIYSKINPRVSVPRNLGDARPYYVEQLKIDENSGFYCFFNAENQKEVEIALNLLETEGLGTDRNLGFGKFNYRIIDLPNAFENLFKQNYENCTNLSLYIPENENILKNQLLGDNIGYELINRGGWITTEPFLTKRKNNVYMFKEGSILKKSNNDYVGKTVNVCPDILKNQIPVWRIGKSFFIDVQF